MARRTIHELPRCALPSTLPEHHSVCYQRLAVWGLNGRDLRQQRLGEAAGVSAGPSGELRLPGLSEAFEDGLALLRGADERDSAGSPSHGLRRVWNMLCEAISTIRDDVEAHNRRDHHQQVEA